MQLADKRVVVTGGASGTGAAAVRALARAGAAVAALDVQDDLGEAVATEADQLGPGPVFYLHADVSRQVDVDAAVDEAVERLRSLDALFAIAGIEQVKPAEDITEADLQRQLDVNLKGTVFSNQAAFRVMHDTGGAIVNTGSFAGVRGMPGQAGYSAAKGAILAWTRTVAREWGRHGIRVNVVNPLLWTPIADQHKARLPADQWARVEAEWARSVPLGGTLGDPDTDWGPVAVFLASDASRFLTGQMLNVDGGMLMPS